MRPVMGGLLGGDYTRNLGLCPAVGPIRYNCGWYHASTVIFVTCISLR
jgi:hypothetical protein